MKMYQRKRGFTLIELLVVVLIIGILAAVALPQYNKAVLKARVAEQLELVSAIYPAAQACYLETDDPAQCTLDKLDIEAGTCRTLPGYDDCNIGVSFVTASSKGQPGARVRVNNSTSDGINLQLVKFPQGLACSYTLRGHWQEPICANLGFTADCPRPNTIPPGQMPMGNNSTLTVRCQ